MSARRDSGGGVAPADGAGGRRLALLVGAFRSMVPEGDDGPLGGQGGFVDTLGPEPYSLANGTLCAYALADPEVARVWRVETLTLSERLHIEDEREEVELGLADAARILERAPDLVGFSAYCWNVEAFLSLAVELRRARPDLRIVMGGRATDGGPHELLASAPSLDALVVGEGERAFVELLRRYDEGMTGIAGVVARDAQGGVLAGPRFEMIDALDEIPSPYLEGTLAPARHGVMLELGRGCLHACGYCTWNAGKPHRLHGPERVEAEVRWALAQGHRHATLVDSAINYDEGGLRRTVDAIRRADPEGLLRFTYNIRHDHLTEGQLRALSRLPTHMILFGVETLFEGGMGAVRRSAVDVEALARALDAIARAVRPPVVSIILGLPGDTERAFLRTLDHLMAWTAPREGAPPLVGTVLVSLLQVYRGSLLWERREALGLKVREEGIPYLLEGGGWTREALARAKAELVRRMAAAPERLKAAEAIVLMESMGGVSPWLTRRRVRALLGGLRDGEERGGFTLEGLGLMRDRAQGLVARFRDERGAPMRVLLEPCARGDGRPGPRSRRYRLSRLPGQDGAPGEEAWARLEAQLVQALAEGERALAARASEERRRMAEAP